MRVKLVVTFAFIVATTSIPPGKWPAFGVMILLVWSAATLSRIGLVRVFTRSLVAVPFILIALPTVFTKPGAPVFELDLLLFSATATGDGVAFFLSVLLKSWTAVTAAVLLTSTTEAFALLGGLRSLRLPAILVAIVMLMYRYLFVIVDEAQRMLRARSARSASVGPDSGGTILWRAKGAGGMAGSLFIRTLDRSERIYLAMLSRGYDGNIRQRDSRPVGRLAAAQITAALALFAIVAVSARVLI